MFSLSDHAAISADLEISNVEYDCADDSRNTFTQIFYDYFNNDLV